MADADSAETPVANPLRVALLAVPDCMGSAVLGSLEAFTMADALQLRAGRRFDVRVVTPGPTPVVGFGGLELPASRDPEALRGADIVMVPPLLGSPAELETTHAACITALGSAIEQGATAAATCTGTFLLAETGALDGRRATTTPAFRELFAARYPKVLLRPALRVVDEGSVVTAGATTSYLDLSLALIQRVAGPRVATDCARLLATDPNPRSQQPFLLPRPPPVHADDAVRRAEVWLAEHRTEALDTDRLARRVGVGERTLLRRFRSATGESPREALQRLRVEAAMHDLEATDLSVDEITTRCGYADPRAFRRLFQRLVGLSPRDYRKRFGRRLP